MRDVVMRRFLVANVAVELLILVVVIATYLAVR